MGCDFPGMPKETLRKPSGGNTDLLSEEGHDGEDDQRHEDAVRPKLQLVPVHPPEDRRAEDVRRPAVNNTSVIGPGRH